MYIRMSDSYTKAMTPRYDGSFGSCKGKESYCNGLCSSNHILPLDFADQYTRDVHNMHNVFDL